MQLSKKWMASLLGLTLPYLAHAEAFKPSRLTPAEEKTIFFLLLLILIGTAIVAYFLLIGIWEWLTTGKTEKLKNNLFTIVFVAIFTGIIWVIRFFMTLFH